MAYLGSWKIDDYINIPVTTHRFSTGAAYAPTSLTYSIYEDVGTTGIVEDTDMTPASPHDGIVGFYIARPQLTAAAGFEKGKNYTVLIKATVDGVSAIIAHTFQIEAEVDSNTNSGGVAVSSIANNAITAAAIATDAIDADAIKADAVTEIQSGLATAAALTVVDDFLDTEIAAILADTNELQTDLVNGGRLDLLIDAIKAKTDNLPASPAAVGSAMTLANDSITSAVLAATAITEIQTGLATPTNITAGTLTTVTNLTNLPAIPANWLTAAGMDATAGAEIADAVWDEALAGHVAAGTAGEAQGKADDILSAAENAEAYVADLTDGGRLDLLIDSILEDTGTTLDTLVKDIPTNAELATALGTADDAVLAAVAAAKTVIDDIHNTDLPAVKAETALIVEDTGTTLPATLASILEDTGTTLPAAIIAGSAGSGATAKTYTVTVNGQPVSGVHVWATTDLAGANIVASGYTNDSGIVTFYLDSGTTYYIWRQHKDYTFINPDTEVA